MKMRKGIERMLKFFAFTCIFLWNGIFCQEHTPFRKTFLLEFPSPDAAYLNPALIAEGDGQSVHIGYYADRERYKDFFSIRSRLFHNIYLGLSLFEFRNELYNNAPALVNNVYLLTAATRYGFSLPWLHALSAGVNFMMNQQDIFHLVRENYESVDAGLNAHFFNKSNFSLKSGIVFQNLKSNPMGDSHVFKRYVDWSFVTAFWKDKLYFSGTVNIVGDGKETNSGSLMRFGGIFRNAVYGIRPVKYLDLSLKYKSDDAAWISLDGIMPASWIIKKLKYLHFIIELTHDRLKEVPSEPGLRTVIILKLETAFGKSRVDNGEP